LIGKNLSDRPISCGDKTIVSIPLLDYSPSSQNHRVSSFEMAWEEQPRIFNTDNLLSTSDFDVLINAAYRQIFHEQQTISRTRQISLESQLRIGQITVRQFIRGLATSESFRNLTFNSNNNYRVVQICIQRILGREVYNEREKIAWSIVIATKGFYSFIDELLSSQEYQENFGDSIVPYQRRRILSQQIQGQLPFERMARYGTDYRDKLPKPNLRAIPGMGYMGPIMSPTRWNWQKQPSSVLTTIGKSITYSGAAGLAILSLAVFLSWFGWIHL
jgi:phycobilisome rod-core linker protein